MPDDKIYSNYIKNKYSIKNMYIQELQGQKENKTIKYYNKGVLMSKVQIQS